jgi:hypothetical protein
MSGWFLVVRCLFFLPLPTYLLPTFDSDSSTTPKSKALNALRLSRRLTFGHFYSSHRPKQDSKMSDVESVSTISAVDSVTAVGETKAANGGKRWGPIEVSFHV